MCFAVLKRKDCQHIVFWDWFVLWFLCCSIIVSSCLVLLFSFLKKRRSCALIESFSSSEPHQPPTKSKYSTRKSWVTAFLRFSSSKRNTLTDEISEFNGLSLHEEDETIKPNEFPSEQLNSTHERTRTPSNESVFNHDTELIYQRFLEGTYLGLRIVQVVK